MLLTSIPQVVEENITTTYTRSRQWFCRKIGLRCESTKLQRIAELMNGWFSALGGLLLCFDGYALDADWGVRPGEVGFRFTRPRIPRQKTRRSNGLVKPKLKRFPPDLNLRDSQRVKNERIFVH